MERIIILGLTLLSGCILYVEGTCDTGAADSCIQTGVSEVNSLPFDNQAYCRESSLVLQKAVMCVVGNVDTCSSIIQDDYNNRLNQDVGSPINSKCSGIAGCGEFLADLIGFHTCTNDAESIAAEAAQNWNDRLVSKPACYSSNNDNTGTKTFQDVRQCFKVAIGTCNYLKDVFTDYLMATPNVKLAYTACGAEFDQSLVSEPVCSDKYTKEQNIRDNCRMATIDWDTANPTSICQKMQTQLNCIVREADACDQVLDHFLKPRLDAYAMMNRMYQCNISLYSFEIYSITDSGNFIGCDFNGMFSCYDDFGFTSATTTNQVSALKDLFDLSEARVDNVNCDMKYYNFNEMEECLQEKMLQCFYPWVTFRDLRELPGDLDYAPSLGPFLFNDIGLDGVGAFVHYHCYIDCRTEGQNSALEKLGTDCNNYYNVPAIADIITTRYNNGQDIAIECTNLQNWAHCVSGLIQQCPSVADYAQDLVDQEQNLEDSINTYCKTRIVMYATPPTAPPATSRSTPSPGTIKTVPPTPSPPSTTVVTTPSTARQSVVQSVMTTKSTTTTSRPVITTPKGFTHGTNPTTTTKATPNPTVGGGVMATFSVACILLSLTLQRLMS